jgi:hypothetical protein
MLIIKNTIIKRFVFRNFIAKKAFYQLKYTFNKNINSHIVFVVGCQRSGTSILMRVFERDLKSKIFMEHSDIFDNGERSLRLKPFDIVKNIYEKYHVPLIVSKPLLDTQLSLELLEYFKGAKIVFIFRHYKDVVSSFLKQFGERTGIKDITPIYNNEKEDWRSQKTSNNTMQIIKNFYDPNMDFFDAAGLFWYIRNSLFFDLKLYKHPNVLMCKYEDLVNNPDKQMRKLYNALGFEYPGKKIIKSVHNNSAGKGKDVILNSEIEILNQSLWGKLNNAYERNIANIVQ